MDEAENYNVGLDQVSGEMQRTAKLAMILLVGFVVGSGVINTTKAQGAKKPAYVIVDVEVTDPAAFASAILMCDPGQL